MRLPSKPVAPDCVFVEDMAIVTDEIAIITNPGAVSRRQEVAAVAEVLGRFRSCEKISEPATLDGGDVLVAGRDAWVGVTARTNEWGLAELRKILQRYGYKVTAVRPRGCLHLKSAVTRAGENCLLINPNWVAPGDFSGWRIIEVDEGEDFAANVLWLGEVTLVGAAHAGTRRRLKDAGIQCRTIDMSELAKAEGGLTCCSVLFDV